VEGEAPILVGKVAMEAEDQVITLHPQDEDPLLDTVQE
jgi:hypothetical protein